MADTQIEIQRWKGRAGAGTGMKCAGTEFLALKNTFTDDAKKRHGVLQRITRQTHNSADDCRQPNPQVKNVQSVLLGRYEVETWYFSPYPDDYSKLDKVQWVEWIRMSSLSPTFLSFRRFLGVHAICSPTSPPQPAPLFFVLRFLLFPLPPTMYLRAHCHTPDPTPTTLPLCSFCCLTRCAPAARDAVSFYAAAVRVRVLPQVYEEGVDTQPAPTKMSHEVRASSRVCWYTKQCAGVSFDARRRPQPTRSRNC